MGQAQDAAHELRHRANVLARGQRAQHVGKRAVPALLQRLLGDDGAHLALRRQQVDVLWRIQVVVVRGLDGDLLFGQTQLHQIRLGVFGMDKTCVAHVLARALHLHQQDGADVAIGFALQRKGLSLQAVEPLQAAGQTTLPITPAAHIHMNGQLDHLGFVQIGAAHIHQNVGAAALVAADPWRGRQFQHETRVEAVNRLECRLGVGVVAFVNDDHGAQQAHHIAERAFHNAPLGCPRLFLRGTPGGVGVQVGHGLQQVPVRLNVILARRVAQHIAPVAEEAQRLFVFTRSTRQHEQHDAQVRVSVDLGQRRAFFQNLHLSRARHIEHLAVRVVAVLQRLERLLVNRLVGHDPQHQPGVPLQVVAKHAAHAGRSQQRFAAAGGNLQTHIGNGTACAIKAAAVRLVGKRGRQALRFL